MGRVSGLLRTPLLPQLVPSSRRPSGLPQGRARVHSRLEYGRWTRRRPPQAPPNGAGRRPGRGPRTEPKRDGWSAARQVTRRPLACPHPFPSQSLLWERARDVVNRNRGRPTPPRPRPPGSPPARPRLASRSTGEAGPISERRLPSDSRPPTRGSHPEHRARSLAACAAGPAGRAGRPEGKEVGR